MLFNSERHELLFLGLAIALTSCTNPGDRKPTQIIVAQPTPSPQVPAIVTVSPATPLFVNPPVSPISQSTPKATPKPKQIVVDSPKVPVIYEGNPHSVKTSTNKLRLPPRSESVSSAENDLESEIQNSLSNEFGIDINSVNCPNLNSIGQGKTATCQVKTNGGNFSVKVTNKGQQVEYEPQGIVLISVLQSNLENAIANRQGKKVKATCPGEVLIFGRGDYINCRAIDAAGKTRSARVTFNNLTGNPGGINVAISGDRSTSSTSSSNSPKPSSSNSQKPSSKPLPQNTQAALQNSQKLEKSLKGILTKEIGMPIQSVACPDRVEKNFSKVYNCQANTAKGKFSLAVKLTNPQGGFRYQSRGVILPSKLGQLITQEVENSTGRKVEVDCGETPIIFQPGESLGCQISTGRGEPQNIKVTVQDAEGKKVKVDYSLAG